MSTIFVFGSNLAGKHYGVEIKANVFYVLVKGKFEEAE